MGDTKNQNIILIIFTKKTQHHSDQQHPSGYTHHKATYHQHQKAQHHSDQIHQKAQHHSDQQHHSGYTHHKAPYHQHQKAQHHSDQIHQKAQHHSDHKHQKHHIILNISIKKLNLILDIFTK